MDGQNRRRVMMISEKWARRVTALAFACVPIAAYAGPQPATLDALRPLVVRDSQGALVGRLAEPGLVHEEFYEVKTVVVRRISSGILAPLVVKRDGIIGGTTYPELVHAAPRCASPGVMWWTEAGASLLPPTFTDGLELTYGAQATTLTQIASFTLYHLPAGWCTGPWQDGTAFPLPNDRCCFTWSQPYSAGDLPFAVPATVNMSSWNLVPPFHVE